MMMAPCSMGVGPWYAPIMWHKRPVLRSDVVCVFLPAYAQDTQDDAFNTMAYTHYAAQVVSASQQLCTHILTCITQDIRDSGGAVFNTGTADRFMLFPGNTLQQVSALRRLYTCVLT